MQGLKIITAEVKSCNVMTASKSPIQRPRQAYQDRLQQRTNALQALEGTEKRLSNARLLVFVAALALGGYMLWGDRLHPAWLTLPGLIFLVLVVVHDRIIRRLERARQAVAHYEIGLERLADRWQEHGITDDDIAPEDHPYAADLDLFGQGSLYQLLCAARTRAGEEALVSWLLAPSPPEEVAQRQVAVAELAGQLDLREDLALLGGGVRAAVRPSALVAWADAPRSFQGTQRAALRVASWLVPAAAMGAAVAWGVGLTNGLPLLAIFFFSAGVHRLALTRLERLTAGVDRAERDLVVLGRLLARLEAERFDAPLLARLCKLLAGRTGGQLSGGAPTAARAIRALSRLVSLHDSIKNAFFAPLGMLLMWSFHLGMALERWRLQHGRQVGAWLEAVGQLEALASLAAYAFERPDDIFPELLPTSSGPPRFEAQGLGHPLLPRDRCVRNPVCLDAEQQLLVVSGSNMSGKSTLLRTVGINAVLAQAGAPVRAAALRLTPLMPGSTIRVQDSLQRGSSRFYQEISQLKQLIDLAEGTPPLLFLLDEILHGTNSQDRRVGATALLERFLQAGAVGLVTTHDLALSEEVDRFDGKAHNVHFVDTVEQGELKFDYKVRQGVVTRSNAIALMRSVGLPI